MVLLCHEFIDKTRYTSKVYEPRDSVEVAVAVLASDRIGELRVVDERADEQRHATEPERPTGLWAFVTGAASGVDEALARQLGYEIVIVARDEARLAACSRELTKASGVNTLLALTKLSNLEGPVVTSDQIRAADISIERVEPRQRLLARRSRRGDVESSSVVGMSADVVASAGLKSMSAPRPVSGLSNREA